MVNGPGADAATPVLAPSRGPLLALFPHRFFKKRRRRVNLKVGLDDLQRASLSTIHIHDGALTVARC